jgi:predicted nucleic acid-binding Zn ribbon protein
VQTDQLGVALSRGRARKVRTVAGPRREQRYPGQDRRHAGDLGPRPVLTSLADAARALGVDGAVEVAALRRSWPSVVGPQAAAHCWPVSIERGQLVVATDHAAWACELRILSDQVLLRARTIVPEVRFLAVQVSPLGGHNW